MYFDWKNSSGICLERLRKTKKNVKDYDRFSRPSLNADLQNTSIKQSFNNAKTIFANVILKLEYNYINILEPTGYVMHQQV